MQASLGESHDRVDFESGSGALRAEREDNRLDGRIDIVLFGAVMSQLQGNEEHTDLPY